MTTAWLQVLAGARFLVVVAVLLSPLWGHVWAVRTVRTRAARRHPTNPAHRRSTRGGGPVTTFEPYRLVQARRVAGLDPAGVAEAIGVTRVDVQKWEFAISQPRPDQVRHLAQALGVLPEFFTAGRPMARLDVADVHFRPAS